MDNHKALGFVQLKKDRHRSEHLLLRPCDHAPLSYPSAPPQEEQERPPVVLHIGSLDDPQVSKVDSGELPGVINHFLCFGPKGTWEQSSSPTAAVLRRHCPPGRGAGRSGPARRLALGFSGTWTVSPADTR